MTMYITQHMQQSIEAYDDNVHYTAFATVH